MAPVTPFISEVIYHNLTGSGDSVHLTDWPKFDQKLINPDLENDMNKARQLVEKIHSQRKALNLPLRQPLAKAVVAVSPLPESLTDLVLAETNLKDLQYKSEGGVELDTLITTELKAEGDARDIVRKIQAARKAANTGLSELVMVELPAWPKDHADDIKKQALVKELRLGKEFKLVRL